MNCQEIRRHWNLYHDSEGDAELHWHISEHLANCASCAEWFSKQSRFEELVATKLQEGPSDGDLWNVVLSRSGLLRPATSRRWLFFSTLAACAAGLLIALATWSSLRHRDHASTNLSALTAAWHEELTTGHVSLAFKSSSDLEVEDFLRRQVQFPVRCPPRQDSGFSVVGAGTCRLATEPTAFVVGAVDAKPVSIFILSRRSLPAFPHQQAKLARERIHRCREGNHEMALSVIDENLVVVIGEAPPDRLLRVLGAYGTYPHSKS